MFRHICVLKTHFHFLRGKKSHILLNKLSVFFVVWHRSLKSHKASKEGLSVLNDNDKELAELRGLAAGVGPANACYAVQYVAQAIFLDHIGRA